MEVKDCGFENSKVEFYRDFPSGFGISSSKIVGFYGKNKFHDYVRDWPIGCGPNASNSIDLLSNKLSESKKNCGFDGDSSTWRRNVSAVKSKTNLGGDYDELMLRNPQNSKRKEPIFMNFREGKLGQRGNFSEVRKPQKGDGKKELVVGNFKEKGGGSNERERNQVLEMLRVFRKRCTELSMNGKGRVDTMAYSELKGEGKIVNRNALIIGSVPGIEIGDKFHFRLELVLVGLHRQTQGGIDTMDLGRVKLTTCIVANEKHMDLMNDPNALVYIGEGGNLKRNQTGLPPDQELKGGNRALYNSMERKKPVRVVRGLMSERSSRERTLYVYDGLYDVKNCQQEKGPQGNMIFKFKLVRRGDQPPVPWKECRRYSF